MRRRLGPWAAAVAVASVSFVLPASAADKRAFAIPDLYRLSGVEEPAIAPDGKSIVYKLTVSDLAAVKRQANLWRVAPDGTDAQALTFVDKTDSAPRFSPDGKTLHFLSTRAGDPQVFAMSGGEPRQRTDFPGGVGAFTLSGDGRLLAVTADVCLECGVDAACNKKIDDARAQAKLKVHVADDLLYRHWTGWRDGTRTHVLLLDLTSASRDREGPDSGRLRDANVLAGRPAGFAFSPDGKELCFSATARRTKRRPRTPTSGRSRRTPRPPISRSRATSRPRTRAGTARRSTRPTAHGSPTSARRRRDTSRTASGSRSSIDRRERAAS